MEEIGSLSAWNLTSGYFYCLSLSLFFFFWLGDFLFLAGTWPLYKNVEDYVYFLMNYTWGKKNKRKSQSISELPVNDQYYRRFHFQRLEFPLMLLPRQTRPAKCCAVSFKNLIIDLKTKQEGFCLYSFAFPSMDYLSAASHHETWLGLYGAVDDQSSSISAKHTGIDIKPSK